MYQKTRLVKFGYVMLDGTKTKASASKHTAMSYRRLEEAEERLEMTSKNRFFAPKPNKEDDKRYGKDKMRE